MMEHMIPGAIMPQTPKIDPHKYMEITMMNYP